MPTHRPLSYHLQKLPHPSKHKRTSTSLSFSFSTTSTSSSSSGSSSKRPPYIPLPDAEPTPFYGYQPHELASIHDDLAAGLHRGSSTRRTRKHGGSRLRFLSRSGGGGGCGGGGGVRSNREAGFDGFDDDDHASRASKTRSVYGARGTRDAGGGCGEKVALGGGLGGSLRPLGNVKRVLLSFRERVEMVETACGLPERVKARKGRDKKGGRRSSGQEGLLWDRAPMGKCVLEQQ